MTAVRCSSGACVVVTITSDGVTVTDSKDPNSPVLTASHAEWRKLIGPVPAGHHPACVAQIGPDTYAWVGYDADRAVRTLIFDAAEMVRFVRAVRDGKYRVPVAVGA